MGFNSGFKGLIVSFMHHLRFSETELCATSSPAIWRGSVKLQCSA